MHLPHEDFKQWFIMGYKYSVETNANFHYLIFGEFEIEKINEVFFGPI